MEQQHAIRYLALSQEELIDAGAFDLQMSIAALEKGLLDFEKGKILFPDKIVQIFDPVSYTHLVRSNTSPSGAGALESLFVMMSLDCA